VYRGLSTGDGDRWARTNHQGEPVTLAAGPAVSTGAVAGSLLAPGIGAPERLAVVAAVMSAGLLGAVDDLHGRGDVKGFAGHLRALASGEVTSGTLKLAGLGAAGIISGAMARRGRGGVIDAMLAGTVVAGAANFANLLDLRPGRAGKAFLLASAPALLACGTPGDLVSPACGSAAAMLPEDLGEVAMLGDTGANALGAAWGVAMASSLSRRSLLATSSVIVALTVASERVSFTGVIGRTPVLRELDELGRRKPA
jgi:UDP-N-acetylmuramyl pentapeptide phosphotransferase/UDP-N-acetylglucosamine-1-phosphate transferase